MRALLFALLCDEPPTQQVKVQALRAAGVEHSHVTFAPTDTA
ncbi:MAG: hypothetical protein OYL92_13055 [Acidobacteriota bacterium]|nr:hypothetical protein [Acidobacteriota bacterium]MDE2921880.1 hypothetical protein [Acidobacteriota bacterium]MDE3265890.1 hypothetical protein [Acidobacteriota bacterium]